MWSLGDLLSPAHRSFLSCLSFFHLSSRLFVMDFDEISRLWEKLQLDKSNGLVVYIEQNVYKKGMKSMMLCLIGKIFWNKIVHREELEREDDTT